MRSSRKFLALALALLALFLSACRAIAPASPAPTLLPGEPARQNRSEPMRAFTRAVGLYYPQADGYALQRRTSEIVCEEGMWLPEVLASALLEPVDDPALLTPFGGNAELRSISSCSEMLVVDLDFSDSLDAHLLHASALALARTLTQETGAPSVLILKDGARVRLRGAVTNPVTAEVCADEALWPAESAFLDKGFLPDEYAGTAEILNEPRILFYPDRSGNFILCRETDAPSGRMDADDFARILSMRPDGRTESMAARYGLVLQGLSREDPGDGRDGIRVALSAPEALLSDYRALRRIRAALYLDLRLNDRSVSSVAVEINGRSVGEILEEGETWYAGADAREQFGEEITLYFLSHDRQALVPVRRIVSFADSVSPEAWMRELLKGPDSYDPKDVRGVFPEGIGEDDLLHVETDGVNAVVNFGSALESAYPAGDEGMERMMVYSIVNTLTEDAWIKRVLLHVEGRQVDSLGGALYLGTPLMRNPGLIRASEGND